MALLQALSSGLAPQGASVGDYVSTNGGMYQVTQPGAFGSSYNPQSGYWSVPVTGSADITAPSVLGNTLTNAQAYSRENSELSQLYAREQMDFQEAQAARAMAFSAQSAEQAAAFNRESAREAMAFNRNEAQKQRDWQEEMSNTSYQRAVKDLLAAGLNPVLAAMHSGASTPTGAAASGSTAQMSSPTGIASAGAQGQVDTSYNALLGSVISAMASRQTTLDAYQLQAAISQYTADSSRLAALGSASIAASSAQLLNQRSFQQDLYKLNNYPDNMWQFLNNALNAIAGGSSGQSMNLSSRLGKRIFDSAQQLGNLLYGRR